MGEKKSKIMRWVAFCSGREKGKQFRQKSLDIVRRHLRRVLSPPEGEEGGGKEKERVNEYLWMCHAHPSAVSET